MQIIDILFCDFRYFNIKLGLRMTVSDDTRQVQLAQDRDQWWAILNTTVNLWGQKRKG
jgi:hypothetical protein